MVGYRGTLTNNKSRGGIAGTSAMGRYDQRLARCHRWYSCATLLYPAFFVVLLVWFGKPLRMGSARPIGDIQRFWGQYSPYYAVEEYQLPPKGCEVTQVNILQRHGARYPTSGMTKSIRQSLKKLQNASKNKGSKLKFITSYQWHLGESDIVQLGAAQSYASGTETYLRYKHLVFHDTLPFVRSSGGTRVVDSAAYWTAGFSNASGRLYRPTVSVIIPETNKSNNTLHNRMCPNFKKLGGEKKLWGKTFSQPIVQRLNKIAIGADIVSDDIPEFMALCAFDTIYQEKRSPFCDLFTLEEFQAYGYYQDLSTYYKTGYGNPLGRVQGVGYVNELLARLTGSPVQDLTQTNSTLNLSPDGFPLNKTIYADFSHGAQMISIYCALGLFPQTLPPTAATADQQRTWVASRLIPFSARMITEKLSCSKAGASEDYVRILVNNAVQPLAFCGGDKLCRLEEFVESQVYARSNGDGDFEKCRL